MWKKEEVNYLVDLYYLDIPLYEIAIKLNKSELSIYKKLKRIGKFKGRNTTWSKDEELKLKKLINEKNDISYISNELNRTKNSIDKKIKRLGLVKKSFSRYESIDWNQIQIYYDSGKTYKDILNLFDINPQDIIRAKKECKIKLRNLKEAYQQSLISGNRKIKTKDVENNYKEYREMCAFKFNLNDFKEEFDFQLIEKFGWYKAKNNGNNPIGVSRDHKISVKYGFENKIDPKVISHPANCQLVQQSENASKGSKNSISFEDLINDIDRWNIKFLTKFLH